MPSCTPTSNALYIFQSGTFPSCNIFPGETFHNNICGIRLFLENLFLQSGGFFYCATVNQLDKEAYHNAKNFQKGFWSPQVICSSITHKKERKLPFSVLCTVRSWEFLGVLPKHCYIHNNTSKKKKKMQHIHEVHDTKGAKLRRALSVNCESSVHLSVCLVNNPSTAISHIFIIYHDLLSYIHH